MPDETTSNPVPVDAPVSQESETLNSTPSEAIIVPAPVSEPIPEPSSGHLGGNDPIEPAPAESIPPALTVEIPAETPVTVNEPALTETPIPEPAPTETTRQTPAEPVIETVETSTPVQAPTEATPVAESADSRLGRRVETPAPTPVPAPVAQTINPAPTPAQIVATAVAPIVATTIAQTFTKSMRELFTKALGARQNKKKKKLDRIMSLFAKQTMITNNEVENLLHVSDSTATRYLATLTKEGKIKQNTKKGQATSYSKI